MLEYNLAGKFTDLWGLGLLLYQFLVGVTPFHGKTSEEVFSNILERKLKFPQYLDKEAVDLIDRLLDYNIDTRIGVKDINDIKNHPFFHDINFDFLASRKLKVPCQDFFHQHTMVTDNFDELVVNRPSIMGRACYD